ncbi:hypothetical protein [Maledivibacter halophilus]|uniref:Fluoroquinolone transport system permease protein n=1 Tax=Maledivibacter halophilus TaxID=36842 RepID=A0A1T5MIB1_9FIRM|nr:hypothetical protein [Maledivibacter halophilus]SKC87981.1 fluoroquinolone transport system permease protein [Maledivibacter halophilus]
MKKIIALSYNDLKNVIREPMLLFLILGPLVMSLVLRWLIPLLTQYLLPYTDLEGYYPLISGFVLIFTPVLLGMLTGFLLLDERDDHVIITLIITPLAKNDYIVYRVLLPTIISFLYGLLILPLVDLVNVDIITIIPIAILAALEAPLIALYLVVFAGNKVEGLALSKALGIFMLAPIAGYFLDSKLKLLAGFIPFYWPVMALVIGNYSDILYWIHILIGLVIHLIFLKLLLIRFDNRIS